MSTAATGGLPAQTRDEIRDQTRDETRDETDPEDPLLHPDAVVAADSAATENLLRCWIRETGLAEPPGGALRIALGEELRLVVPVRHWSPSGWHRFGRARLSAESGPGHPVDAVTVAALLAREAGVAAGGAAGAGGADARAGQGTAADDAVRRTAELAGRVADSVRRTARFLADRRDAPLPAPGTTPFLESEQDLLLGHPLHPTPKSREGLGEAETAAYSPELRGAHRLHWFAVDHALAAGDSALPEDAAAITAALAPPLPSGTTALPLHPWQARELTRRPEIAELLAAGRLHDLGPHSPLWYPTSSLRTVYRPDLPYMLKLSLGLSITNSRRENLRKELHRGLEVHRLLDAGLPAGLGAEWRAAHPGFDILRDPAWIGADLPGRDPSLPSGLDTVIRSNPFGPRDRVRCLAGLVAGAPVESRLGSLVGELARRTGRSGPTVAAEWFLRYLNAVVLPVLWLDGHAGIALEAHQQNTLVLLDAHGWPVGGRYRDNQGYYFRESRAAELRTRLPGLGAASDTFVPDTVADERFGYYLGINNLLGLVGAFGSQQLVDERVLLAALRRFLTGRAVADCRSTLPELLLDAPVLRCKANLLTRLHGLDELVGPVETQSVYVALGNPLVATRARETAGVAR